MAQKSKVDFSQGPVWKCILAQAMPLTVAQLVQLLYNVVDRIYLGHMGDGNSMALTGVGLTFPIITLIMAFTALFGVGGVPLFSMARGAGDTEKAGKILGNSFALLMSSAGILMACGFLFCRPILFAFGASEESYVYAKQYLDIYLLGTFFSMTTTGLNGYINAQGFPKIGMLSVLIGAVTNIILDPLFIFGLGMGVSGAALATIIAQIVSASLCMVKLAIMRKDYDFGLKFMIPRAQYIKTLVRLGLPSGLTQAIFSSAMIIVQSLTNQFGEQFIAANVVIMRVDGFAMMPNFTFGQAMSVYTGQNVGAGKFDRVTKGVKQGGLIAGAFSTCITVILLFCGKFLFALFTETPELIDLATRMIRIMAVGYICISVTQVLGGVMRGAGDTVSPMWISIISTIIIRVPLAYFLAHLTRNEEFPHGQPIALFGSLVSSWILGMLISIIVFSIGKWKKKMLESHDGE